MTLQVIDQRGNRAEYHVESVPRIGERIVLSRDRAVVSCYRVIDVVFRLDARSEDQVSVLIEEDDDSELWPSDE